VPLPDLRGAAPSVREQIETRHAEVTAEAANPATPRDRLAASFGELGQVLLAAGLPEAAEPALRNAEALAPAEAKWTYYRGEAHRRRSDLAAAADAFAQVLRTQPAYNAAAIALAEIHLSDNDPAAADAVLRPLLARQPSHAAALGVLGRTQIARREYRLAIDSLERALAADPTATGLHYPLSLAYRASGDTAAADRHLARRGSTMPRLDDPWMQELTQVLESGAAFDRLSRAALARGDWTGALAHARRGLAVAGDNPTLTAALQHRIGTALAQTGDRREALRAFDASVKTSPGFAPGHYSRGLMLMAAGRTDAAVDAFRQAVRHQPSYVEARVALGDVLRQVGRAGEALEHYRAALGMGPAAPAPRFGEALALAALGRYAEARDRLTAAASDFPGDPNFVVALARILAAAPAAALRDGGRARALVEPLVQARPTFESVEALAMALAELGRFEDAAALQQEAIAEAQRTGETATAARLRERLRGYERRQPARDPWLHQPLYEPR
jgi:tetratricopeptide (TPR) repeat protein